MGKLSLRYFGTVVWETLLPDKYKTITLLEKFKTDIIGPRLQLSTVQNLCCTSRICKCSKLILKLSAVTLI